MQDTSNQQEFSLKRFFIPLTTKKAIHIIAIVGFIVYFNMLFNGFVWDDITYILNNPQVHSINLSTIFGPSLFNSSFAGFYRPIYFLYTSLLYSVFQDTSFIYHITQLLLHIVNTILVYFLFKRFFSRYLALFLSLLFLIHPIQVESVSYIIGANSVLFFLFGISALLLSRKYTIKNHTSY